MNDQSPLSLSSFLYSSFSRTYQLLERHNTVTLLVSPMCYSLDQKLTVISLGLEVEWDFVFLASCSSLSQEKEIILWTLLFPRYYVLINSRKGRGNLHVPCPIASLGPTREPGLESQGRSFQIPNLVTVSLKSFSWSPRHHRTEINCSMGRNLRLFSAEPMCTTLFYATIS